MKVMRHESLGIYIYAKPKSQREKEYNDRMREKAEALRCRRFESIVNERCDFFDIWAFPLIGKRRKPRGKKTEINPLWLS